MTKRTYLYLLFSFYFAVGVGQNEWAGGWLPKFNISKKIAPTYKWVAGIETREEITTEPLMASHQLLDISNYFSVQIGANSRLNIGYIIRFKGEDVIHRSTQQFNCTSIYANYKLAHRFAVEQFFQKNKNPQYRGRYRLTFEKALNGDKIDVKEWYFKGANEYLYQFNARDFEIRIVPSMGYLWNKNNKIEFGLDYRLAKVGKENTSQNIWFRTTWYFTIQ
ncbi:DUF2490 domain-containing protein [Tenacibaculum sp. SG-28]|uniref:DUF2490 domain-containing protein n=1 Tax=Tenacibaculum sp. SG-28 TaxID=754426 RepID=UPI000CF47C68|nr:DUF2490 domain-containing protein [Tenacibaculum sp. SG-28]PQJ21726.1 hypothetical protein BSU00_06500 [Tenacibaculum sp. SG-28]